MTATTVILAAVLLFVSQQSRISTFEIDRDRAALADEIKSAEIESAKYSGGAIKTFIDLRIAILRSTASMLDQKRASFVYLVALQHTVDGKRLNEASDAELQEILDELAAAEKVVLASKTEAARYSGGLIQTMALLRASTEEVSVSQLRLKFYSAKYGIPISLPSAKPSNEPKTLPGQVVKDREAL